MDELHIISEPETHEELEHHEEHAEHITEAIEHEQHETETHLEHLINSNQEEERWRATHQTLSEIKSEIAEMRGLVSSLIPQSNPPEPENPSLQDLENTLEEATPTIMEEVEPPRAERKRRRLGRLTRTSR